MEVVRREGSRTWLRLAKGADDQRVLHAALATGPVSAFVSEHPPLTELYRDLVAGSGRPARTPGAGGSGRGGERRADGGRPERGR